MTLLQHVTVRTSSLPHDAVPAASGACAPILLELVDEAGFDRERLLPRFRFFCPLPCA